MSILDSLFGHSGHYVGMEYHAPGEAHIGCPYCKQPSRLSNASNGYQPKGERIDPRKVFAPGQPASGVQSPMVMCQQAPYAPNMDSTPAHLHEAYVAVKRAITHLEAIQRDSRVDVSVRHKALDALRDAQTAIEAECEAGNAD